MTILAYILAAALILLAFVLALAMRRPDHFLVARTVHVAAPPDRLFPLIDDLRQMNAWNPFVRRETGGSLDYYGPAVGKGAGFRFAGPKSGTGSIEILSSTPNREIEMHLHMSKPMRAENDIRFSLDPVEGGTAVTWAMTGPMPLVSRVMTLFFSLDGMIGREFEKGLADLARISEAK